MRRPGEEGAEPERGAVTGDTVDEDREQPGEPGEPAPEPRTERVRIVGAERAGGRAPAAGLDAAGPGPDGPATAPPAGGEPDAEPDFGPGDWVVEEEPALPHWTEAPTGEVPAVLARDGEDEERWGALPEPTWREERSDWEQDDPFAASLLAATGEPLAPFGEDGADRRPWRFDSSDADEGGDVPGDGWDPDDVAGEKTTVMRVSPDPTAGDLAAEGVGSYGGEVVEDLGERWSAEELLAAVVVAGGGPDAGDDGGQAGEGGEPDGAAALEGPGRGPRRTLRPHAPAEAPPGAGRPGGRGRAPGSGAHRAPDPVSRRAGRNIPLAIASGLVVGAAALVAFRYGTVPSMVVVTAVVGLAAAEAFAAFRRGGHHPATLLGLVAVVSLMVGTYTKGERALPLVAVLLVAFTFLWHIVGVDRRADPVRSAAATLLVFAWVGVLGSFAALLLAPSVFPERHGIAYLLGAIVAGVAYDVGALAAGGWFGRHPLHAASPGKTWEGAIGGTVAAVVLSVAVVRLVHPWTLGEVVALGLIVSVVSPVGDLGESLVKRHLGLKDMGRLLPGHGGLLDRVDGLLFVLPATYYLLRAFHAG